MKNNFTQNLISCGSLCVMKWIVAIALPFLVMQSAFSQLNYVPTVCTAPYVQAQGQAGTVFIGSGDDAIFLAQPIGFTFSFYGVNYTDFSVGTNGFMVFPSGAGAPGLTNTTLPTALAGAHLFPFWDDLDADPLVVAATGVYRRVDGVAPNRILTVEWFQIGHFNHDVQGGNITFQVRLFEGTNRIQYKYFDTLFAGTQVANNNGMSATVGLEGPLPAPRPFTLIGFNIASVTTGQCIEFVLPQACNPTPVALAPVPASPGLCEADGVVVPIPTFNPAGCADGVVTGLRYSINGGPFINVPLPATNITLNNLNVGNNTLIWQTYIISNGATSGTATQIIVVVDTQAPTITCPANILVSLDPGACSAIIDFEISATDNCPFSGGTGTVNTTNVGGNGNSSGGMVFFNINNVSGGPITVTELGMNISNATMVNVYLKAGTHAGFETNAGAWNLVASANATVGPFSGPFPGNGTITPAPTSFVVPPGLFGIALHTLSASSNYTNGNGLNQFFTDGVIELILGSTSNTQWGAPFTPRVFNGYVRYAAVSDAGEATLISGLPSGSDFPIGTTTSCFQVEDAAGNTSSCCFDITVNEFPFPTTTLACNDNVQVSVNEDCEAFVTTDMILEGG
ncbi:MAG TPA: HYR domain-containing protein, partial [Saprospiraceae bacterium]|nr:HYR domain-containing protein [Saprospiraceae bacterium]